MFGSISKLVQLPNRIARERQTGMKTQRSICFDDNDLVVPVKKKYNILEKVELNGIQYEVFNIIGGDIGGKFEQYQCTRVHDLAHIR